MADKNLSAMVQVSDLEILLKTLTVNSALLVFNDQKMKDAYFRLCAAIAIARDMEANEKLEQAVALSAPATAGSAASAPVYALDPGAKLVPPNTEGMIKFKIKYDKGSGYSAKVNACKLVRQIFGWGLLEAKNAVDDDKVLEMHQTNWESAKELAKQLKGVSLVPLGGMEMPK